MNLVGTDAVVVAGGQSHTLFCTVSQVPVLTEVLPRAVPLSRSRVWIFGTGFLAVADRSLTCCFTRTLPDGRVFQVNVSAAVFSNLRVVCWTRDYPSLTRQELQDRAGAYNVSLLVDGEIAAANRSLQIVFQLQCSDPVLCVSVCQASRACFPAVASIFPLSGPSDGGSRVRIVGVGFNPSLATDPRCRFGDDSSDSHAAVVYNDSFMECDSTAKLSLGPGEVSVVSLRVTLNGQDYSPPLPYMYYAVLRLTHASAPAGSVPEEWQQRADRPYGAVLEGGTAINVHGFYFPGEIVSLGDSLCDFGFARTKAEFLQTTVLSCNAPACSAQPNCSIATRWEGTVDILLNGQDGSEPGNALRFIFFRPPAVHKVFPLGSPEDLEVAVRVKGVGFQNFEWFPRCRFGTEQRDAWVINDTDVFCRNPMRRLSDCCESPGCKSCFLDFAYLPNAQNMVWNSSVSFQVYGRPTLKEIIPRGAPSTALNASHLSTTVTILGYGFQSAVASIYIRFLPNSSLGQKSAEYIKSKFYSDFEVLLDPLKWGLSGTIQALHASSELEAIICNTPAYSQNELSFVDVSLNSQDFASYGSLRFKFYDQATVSILSPPSGPLDGGTVVVLGGSGFSNFAEKVLCRFSTPSQDLDSALFVITDAAVNDDKSLVCIAPAVSSTGPVKIAVALNGNDFSEPIYPFVYFSPPKISSFEPAGGPAVGGTTVTLFCARPLAKTSDLKQLNVTCAFGGLVTLATVQIASEHNRILCSAPAHKAEMVLLTISLNGQDYGGDYFFTYYALPVIRNSIPTGATPFRLEQQAAATVTVIGSGFEGFTEQPLCRFGCFTSPANILNDEQIACKAPWPSSHWGLFLPRCVPSEHTQKCAVSECSASGCLMREISVITEIQCILDVWIEISLNGYDFSSDSKLNFRFYESLYSFDFKPSGGPIDGKTEVKFYSTDGLNGFQRLNDGQFTAVWGHQRVVCEQIATEVLLADDFDGVLETGSDSYLATKNALDDRYWSLGSGIKSDNTCGSSSTRGIWFPEITKGNIQGFGATLVSRNSTSKALTFTGTSASGWSGRYAVTIPLDLSRGFRIELAVGYGSSEWPNPCDKPEEYDILTLMSKPVKYFPRSVPPKLRERKYWDVIKSWLPGSNSALGKVVFEVKAVRVPLGATLTDRDMVACPRNIVCNNSLSQLILFQGSHGQGPYDVWLVDDLSLTSFGGITSDSQAVCKSPPQPSVADVKIQISLNGQQFQEAANTFRYYQQPDIQRIEPSGGHLKGGTTVTLTGVGFNAYSDPLYPPKCKFATNSASALILTSKLVVCHSPGSLAAGYVKVAIALNGVDFTSDTSKWSGVSFVYYNHPVLSNVFPDSGPDEGGTFINIMGFGFIMLVPQSPYCKFMPVHNPENVIIVRGQYINNTLIACSTPNISKEFVDDESVIQAVIEISLNGQEYTSAESLYFTFYQEAQISAAEQGYSGNNMVQNGGDPVTVHGQRLRSDRDTRSCFELDHDHGMSNMVFCYLIQVFDYFMYSFRLPLIFRLQVCS